MKNSSIIFSARYGAWGLIGVCALALYYQVSHFLTISYVCGHIDWLQSVVQHYYPISVIAYMVFYVLIVSLTLPGSSMLTMAGGLLFGSVCGFFYSWLSAIVGSLMVFCASRHYIGGIMQTKYKESLEQFNANILRYGHYYLFFIRLFAVLPFGMINVLAGFTCIPTHTYVLITSLAIMPTWVLYSYAGSQLLGALDGHGGSLLGSAQAIGTFIIYVARIIVIPCIIKVISMYKKRSLRTTVVVSNAFLVE